MAKVYRKYTTQITPVFLLAILSACGWSEPPAPATPATTDSEQNQTNTGKLASSVSNRIHSPHWSPEWKSILAANPYSSNRTPPGLWRFDAESGTGAALIPPVSPDETYNLAGWPFRNENGGPIILLYHNGSPARPLVPYGYNIRWGPSG